MKVENAWVLGSLIQYSAFGFFNINIKYWEQIIIKAIKYIKANYKVDQIYCLNDSVYLCACEVIE